MKKRYLIGATTLSFLMLPFAAFAEGTASNMDSFSVDNLTTIMNTLTSTINVGTIVPMLAAILTVGVVFVFLWWGVRKALASIMGSVKKGRVRV